MEWKVKFQSNLDESPYEAGKLAGMQMDSISEALQKLQVTFGQKEVTLSPWVARVNTYDLYWADNQGNFISEFSRVDQEEFEKGIRDWLRSVRREGPTRKLWPMTAQFGGFKVPPAKMQQIVEAGRKQLIPEEFEELEALLTDLEIYGFTPWINAQLGKLMSKITWELEIAPSPEWEEALIACDRAFLGRELRDMCEDAGVSPIGHKKQLCGKLYRREVPEVVEIMEPYLKEKTPERQAATMLPLTLPYVSPLRQLKDRLEDLYRTDPEEFYRRKALLEKAIQERKKGVKKTMPDFTLDDLQSALGSAKSLYW